MGAGMNTLLLALIFSASHVAAELFGAQPAAQSRSAQFGPGRPPIVPFTHFANTFPSAGQPLRASSASPAAPHAAAFVHTPAPSIQFGRAAAAPAAWSGAPAPAAAPTHWGGAAPPPSQPAPWGGAPPPAPQWGGAPPPPPPTPAPQTHWGAAPAAPPPAPQAQWGAAPPPPPPPAPAPQPQWGASPPPAPSPWGSAPPPAPAPAPWGGSPPPAPSPAPAPWGSAPPPAPAPAQPPQLPRDGREGGDCALIVPGPVPGQDACITYEDVNAAFTAAKARVGLPAVKGKFQTHDVGNLATLIYEASRILAGQYQLERDAVANGLPLIDTSQTLIEGFCPPFLMTPKCEVVRYRSIEGMCNNLENPHWGAAMNAHHRFMPPDYADGIASPRTSLSGRPLPSPRVLSTIVHRDEGFHDHAVTMLLVAWGQYLDHDITLTGETKDGAGKTPKCCQDGIGAKAHPECMPIDIPHNDDFYAQYGRKCLNFVRNLPGLKDNCRLGARDTFNEISSFIDAGTMYSNIPENMVRLRTFKGGLLKVLDAFPSERLKVLLPLKVEDPDAGCIRPSTDVFCFLSGDPRVNEQTVLIMVHTLFVREHNRIAIELSRINPHWDDETIFQETRHIMAAVNQQVSYNEFLPMVLGRDVMVQHDLVLLKDGYYTGYNKDINPSASNGFVAGAYRFGHSLLPSTIERWSKTHRYIGSQKLSEMLLQPYDLHKPGWADNYLMGLLNQVAQAMDDSMSQEVTNHMFQEPGKQWGTDLAALNIQRGRDHGLPCYNKWRNWCGLSIVNSWDDLRGIMSNKTVNAYVNLYETPNDLDLWSAGISETPLTGAMVGPTFACIMGRQFNHFRTGDRFWYENSGWPSSFTLEQLAEIRKVRLSRIFCDNADDIESIQVHAMVLPDHEINPRVSCKSHELPRMDLSKWRDASFHASPGPGFGK